MHPYLHTIKTRYRISYTSTTLFILSFTIALISLFLTNLFSNISSYWSIDTTDTPPVPDLFFEKFTHQPSLSIYIEYTMNIFITITFLFILFRRDAIILYFKVFICMSITYLLRMSLIAITNFPSPTYDCIKVVNNFMFSFTYNRCGDLMFSGHTLIVTLCVLVWHSYDIFVIKYLGVVCRIIAYVVGGGILVCILWARNHYTVDVLLGFYLTVFVWVLYGFVWNDYLVLEECFKNMVIE